MTQKRKAELQRKLSIAPVPRPPNGLADRIKNDIPNLQDLQRERQRFSKSILLSAGVAASVLLLFSSAFFTLELLRPNEPSSPPALVMQPKSRTTTSVAETMAPQARAESDQVADAVVPVAERRQVAAKEPIQVAKRRKDDVVAAAAPEPPPPAVAFVAPPQAMPVVAEAPAAPGRVETETAAAGAEVGRNLADEETKTAQVAGARFATKSMAKASDLKLEQTKALFSFSVDASAFERVKKAIERGEKPAPDIVDVSAIVNYFAGSGTTRREVQLDVEASRGPLPEAQDVSLVRFSVDAREGDPARAPEGPPVATNLLLIIEPNRAAVADYRLVGPGKSLKLEQPVLMRNASVTAVMEVDLKPDVSRNTVVMTFRLRYRSVATGKTEWLVGRVRAHQLGDSWLRASRRHRLATLGAVWGQTLRGTSAGADVARTAEELATETPEDSRARELAAAASASYRLRISGSTGSGR